MLSFLAKLDPDVFATSISYGLLVLLIGSFLLLLMDRMRESRSQQDPKCEPKPVVETLPSDDIDLPLM